MEIEARITFTEELLFRGHEFAKDSFITIRVLMIVATLFQLLSQGGKFGPDTFLMMVAFTLVWLFGLPAWRDWREKRNLSVHPWKNKEVVFRFREGFLTLLAPDRQVDIDMAVITRASSDPRGLLVMGPQLGSLWIPREAFSSEAEKESAWAMLRTSLKKKK